MNLSQFVVGNLRREVPFVWDDGIVRIAEGDEIDEPMFVLDLEYVSPERMKEIAERSMTRKVTNPKKGRKQFTADRGEVLTVVAMEAMKGWFGMTGAALRALEARIDFKAAGIGDDDEIPFSKQNLEVLLQHSDLETMVYTVLNDYSFWFPNEEEDSGNSPSGPSGSTDESPATTASGSTSSDTSPSEGSG